MAKTDFGMEQVTKYLKLIDRRMYIVMHSGSDWKPEYGQELEEIDKEISAFRELMDSAPCQDDAPGTDSGDLSFHDYCIVKFSFFRLHGDHCLFNLRREEDGAISKDYSFPDGSVWHERISSALFGEHGTFNVVFWDSACAKFRRCFHEI